MDRWTSFDFRIIIVALLATLAAGSVMAGSGQWVFPFPAESTTMPISDSLTFETALYQAGAANKSLQALKFDKTGAAGIIRQSGLRPNPELELESEEFGGSLPGFSQSEWSLSISQEFELWGKRKARMRESEIEVRSLHLETDIAAFDIYTEVSRRFIELAHAQVKYGLTLQAMELAREMVEGARIRVEKGAAHISELNMTELELARGEINLDEAKIDLANARQSLAALWNGRGDQIIGVKQTDDAISIPDLKSLKKMVAGSREMARLELEQARIKAGIGAAISEARPSPTFRAGIKRLEADDINTFLAGVSIPLPFFNRNQGRQRALQARSSALELELQQKGTEAETELYTIYERLRRLEATETALDRDIIPRADAAFQSLKDAYEKGKLSYLALLEGERTLLELQHEKNDTMLAMRYQIIALEKMLGIRLM